MPPRVRPTPALLSALALACNPWPRFTAEAEPVELFDGIFQPVEVLEEGDWPDDPSTLGGLEPVALLAPMQSARFVGRLDPFDTYQFEDGGLPFDTCVVDRGVEGFYEGDVDFVRISHPGGALCLLLEAATDPAAPLWDVIAYRFDGDCVTGDFLTLETIDYPDLPASIPPGGTNIVDAEAGEIALYVTGAFGSYPPGPVDYTLDVVSTWDRGTCRDLTAENFGDPQ